jgi:hypothetical protein
MKGKSTMDSIMETRQELEKWLRDRAVHCSLQAAGRRSAAREPDGFTEEDRKISHKLAEQMMGRRLPKISAAERAKNAAIDERIAKKLDEEAEMMLRFAAFVAGDH